MVEKKTRKERREYEIQLLESKIEHFEILINNINILLDTHPDGDKLHDIHYDEYERLVKKRKQHLLMLNKRRQQFKEEYGE